MQFVQMLTLIELQLFNDVKKKCRVRDAFKYLFPKHWVINISGSATVITILEVKNEKLRVGGTLSYKLGKYKQSSPSSIAWSHVDG